MKLQDFEGYVFLEINKPLNRKEIEEIEKQVSYARLQNLSEEDRKEFDKDLVIELQECSVCDYTSQDTDRLFQVNMFSNTDNADIINKFLHKFTTNDVQVYSIEPQEEF